MMMMIIVMMADFHPIKYFKSFHLALPVASFKKNNKNAVNCMFSLKIHFSY